MNDIRLSKSGDIEISETGDLMLTTSLCQQIKIHLRWIANEWRLGPELGFPWFEDVLVKNPNIELIRARIRDEIVSIDRVNSANVTLKELDPVRRTATFEFEAVTDEGTFNEEVSLHA